MVDITIHRCTLRIVRHGGWCWGPEPQKVLQSALKALPQLLALELEKYWTDDSDEEISTPIRINVPVRISELLAFDHELNGVPFEYSSEFQILGQRINSAVRAALLREQVASTPPPEPDTPSNRISEVGPATVYDREIVFEVLRSWLKDGVLMQRLAAFSPAALEAWHTSIINTTHDANRQLATTEDQAVVRLVEEISQPLLNSRIETREAILRRRLIILTEVMMRVNVSRSPVALLVELQRIFPLDVPNANDNREQGRTLIEVAPPINTSHVSDLLEPDADETHQRQEPQRRSFESSLPAASETRRHAPGFSSPAPIDPASKHSEPQQTGPAHNDSEFNDPRLFEPGSSDFGPGVHESPSLKPSLSHGESNDPRRFDPNSSNFVSSAHESPSLKPVLQRVAYQARHDASALPFLLLGPLSRIGYFKTLAAVLAATNSLEASPVFATAMAYKVMAPPQRGWRREPKAVATASLFAGLEDAAAEPLLVELSRVLSSQLSPLEAMLSGALIAAHDADEPLLLIATEDENVTGFLLLEAEGLFPIRWTKDISDLHSALVQLDSSIVLIPRACAGREVLQWLDEHQFRFVTDAPQTRNEQWRALRRPPAGRWWTNDVLTSESVLTRMGEVLEIAEEDARTLWQLLAIQCPAIPLARDSDLERHLTMATAIALGMIAWKLWRQRERTAPHLVLERFGDLEAKVHYSRDNVTVSLPLGKRFLDLQSHGLLNDVNDVPWFNGRKLTFTSA